MRELHVKPNLTKRQRSLRAPLCSGKLKLALGPDGFNGFPWREILCLLSDLDETEVYFMLYNLLCDDLWAIPLSIMYFW